MKKLLAILFLTTNVHAYELLLGTGGFLGEKQVGLGSKHTKLIYAFGERDQLSIKSDYQYKFLTAGVFLTRCQCSDTFLFAPSKYETKSYYPTNQYKAGLSFGLKFKYFYVNTAIHDQGLTIIYNEPKFRNGLGWADSRLWSTGLGVLYDF